jgi:hypothetical protein
MRKITVLTFFAFFCLFGISSAVDYKYDQRKMILNYQIQSGNKFVGKVDDKDLSAILRHLKENLYVAVPVSSDALSIKILEQPKGKVFLGAVPLVEGDQHLSAAWKEAWEGEFVALFIPSPEAPVIILKNNIKMTEMWRSLELMHEGTHALAFTTEIFDDIDDPIMRRAVSEYYAYSYECALLKRIGGQKYRNLLAQEAQRIGKEYRETGKINSMDRSHAKKLNSIHGKSLSKMEEEIRLTVFWIHSYFAVMEQVFKTKEEREFIKIDFLRGILANGQLK